jgi:hypothetical protein
MEAALGLCVVLVVGVALIAFKMWMMCCPSAPLKKANTRIRTSTNKMNEKTCFIRGLSRRENTRHVVDYLYGGISRPVRLAMFHHVCLAVFVCVYNQDGWWVGVRMKDPTSVLFLSLDRKAGLNLPIEALRG